MRTCYITTIVDGMVEEIIPLTGERDTDTTYVEQIFLNTVEYRVSNFEEYTAADKEAICDNGYEAFGGDGSVQIHWED